MKWLRNGGVVCWPYEWQRPNKTEEWAYEFCANSLRYDPFVQVVCFPWATLIDARRRNISEKIKLLENALHELPPRMTMQRVTVMQHIWAADLSSVLKELGITDVFWTHARIDEYSWLDNIRIHPFPMYPVSSGIENSPSKTKPICERTLTYSFVGTYVPDLYLTKARLWIYELPVAAESIVIKRSEWHYEGPVYGTHLAGVEESIEDAKSRNNRAIEFRNTLENSIFSLCPSGSGPNSIRLWESISLGAIPVVISEKLRLAGDPDEWAKAAIFIGESPSEIRSLPDRLNEIRKCTATISDMRAAGEKLWRDLFLIDPFFQKAVGRFGSLT